MTSSEINDIDDATLAHHEGLDDFDAMTSVDRDEAAVREAAHFYMAHRMREYPHPDAPDITMAEHTPGDDCPGCRGEAALARLSEQARAAEQYAEALRYYASSGSWRTLETMGTCSANLDRGMVARAALARREARDE